jgi:superfamily II DNA or RNA helicase
MSSENQIYLTKINEVHYKVACNPGIAHELSEYFTFMIPGYRFTPAFRNKSWDGKIRLFNLRTGKIYVGLQKRIENFARDRDYTVDYIPDFSPTIDTAGALEFIESLNLPLMEKRDYQVDSFVHAINSTRGMIISPTGSGKSLLIYLILRYLQKKTLIIVPTTTLVHQMFSDFRDYGFDSEKHVHKVFSGEDKDSPKQVICTTWQSVYKLPKKWFDQFDLVIGDEAHLFKAKSLTSIMENLENCHYRYGLTGSLDGSLTNELVLEGLFGPIHRVTTTAKLMEQKILAELAVKCVILKHPEEIRKNFRGVKYSDEMAYIVQSKLRNKFLTNLIGTLDGNILLLFQFVDLHGKILFDRIRQKYPDTPTYFIHGGVDGEERDDIRKIVDAGQKAVMVASYQCFSTGINIKNLHHVVLGSPSKSRVRILQSIGRGLRTTDTKTKCTLWDISDDLSWKNRTNYTMKHSAERLKLYNDEQFNYKIFHLELKP